MKKVVCKDLSSEVRVENLTDFDLVGVEFEDGVRGQVIRIKPEYYVVKPIAQNNNYFKLISGASIENLLENIGKVSKCFFFGSPQKFIIWLSSGNVKYEPK